MNKRILKAKSEINKEQYKMDIISNLFMSFETNSKAELMDSMYSSLKLVDTVQLICVLIGILFSIIGAEYNLNYILQDNTSLSTIILYFTPDIGIVTACRIIVTITTFPIVVCVVIHYFLLLKIGKYQSLNIKADETIFSSNYYKPMLLEMALNLIHTPPYVNGFLNLSQRNSTYIAEINIDFILTILLLFCRSYLLVRFYVMYNKWFSYRFERICRQCNIQMNFMLSLKAEFKNNPFRLVIFFLLISFFIFGYSVRSIEIFFMSHDDEALDWRYWWNGIWCIIITMSTVGFGDFYPKSILGRTLIVIASFIGTFLISLLVAALSFAMDFDFQEENLYQSIKQLRNKQRYGKVATKLIQCSWRYYFHGKSYGKIKQSGRDEFSRKKSHLLLKLKKLLTSFRKLRKSKNEELFTRILDESLAKIDHNITNELEKIKEKLSVLDDLKSKVESYSSNQNIVKEKLSILFKELQDLNDLKEKFVKSNSES